MDVISGLLYGAAAIAGLFLVLVVGDVQAGGRNVPGVCAAEIDVVSGIEFEKYVTAAMRDLGYQTAVQGPKRSLSFDSTDPTYVRRFHVDREPRGTL